MALRRAVMRVVVVWEPDIVMSCMGTVRTVRTMTNVDEPEMAIEVTEVLMGQKQPTIPIISGITTPVTQPTSGSPAYTVAF
ncbi:hypothetical protein CgunFtcFv8_023942 [Champsocephalus gunnari]|uniref:Uncharacterized protein n=1 Tax=Champsocephalus gunnari TaxID=52237 RepID=A0AAN8DDF7_CHAGU|nr:hypothetical protein CgunFtcFv8_023942 [Champsocephalus gunnari]